MPSSRSSIECDNEPPPCILPELLSKVSLDEQNNKENVDSWLLATESPFTWQPQRFEDVSSDEVIFRAKEKAEYDVLPFDRFIRQITLVYEYAHQNNYKEVEAALSAAESLLNLEQDVDNKKYVTELRVAMSHVLAASRAHVLARQGFHDESKEECNKLVPLSLSDKAAIQALRANFFSLYRKKGFEQAVECSRKALELNPEEPMWMYLLAESLRRMKKYFAPNDEIPVEEMELLEQAVARDRSAKYLVHLAFRYNTCANMTLVKYKRERQFSESSLYETIKHMQRTATELYKEALELEPEDEVINRRVGFGLMKADPNIVKENQSLIKSVLYKALEINPTSSMTLHYLGKYYHRLEKDNEKALEYYEQAIQYAPNFPAYCDLFRLKFEMHGTKEYDPSEDFDRFVGEQSKLEVHFKNMALCHIGSYHLLVKRDLATALRYFQDILDESADHYYMTQHSAFFLIISSKINLYEVIANEIMMNTDEMLPNKKEIISKINSISPEYFKNPNRHLIDRIFKKQKLKNTAEMKKLSNNPLPEETNWRIKNESENRTFKTFQKEKKSAQTEENWRVKNNHNFQNNQTEQVQPRKHSWRQSSRVQENWRAREHK